MKKFTDHTGERHGRLVYLKFAGMRRRDNHRTYSQWVARCDCGNVETVDYRTAKSCGCLRKGRKGEEERSAAMNFDRFAHCTRDKGMDLCRHYMECLDERADNQTKMSPRYIQAGGRCYQQQEDGL
jgi:hypothetical protein